MSDKEQQKIKVKKNLHLAIPTKCSIHANTMLSLERSIEYFNKEYKITRKYLAGKSNIDQARSIMITEWYDSADNDDLFMFIDFKIKCVNIYKI